MLHKKLGGTHFCLCCHGTQVTEWMMNANIVSDPNSLIHIAKNMPAGERWIQRTETQSMKTLSIVHFGSQLILLALENGMESLQHGEHRPEGGNRCSSQRILPEPLESWTGHQMFSASSPGSMNGVITCIATSFPTLVTARNMRVRMQEGEHARAWKYRFKQ